MTTPHGSTPWSVIESITIASMEAVLLADQVKASRKQDKHDEVQQAQKPSRTTDKKGAHRKAKRKGYYMSKIMMGLGIVLAAHGGLGVVEAE